MKHDKDYKIELSYESFHYDDYRYFWYRIVPSELPLFKRLFRNEWKPLYHFKQLGAFTVNHIYTIDEYHDELAGLKTLGDVRRYLDVQDDLKDAAHKKAVENRDIWPDRV